MPSRRVRRFRTASPTRTVVYEPPPVRVAAPQPIVVRTPSAPKAPRRRRSSGGGGGVGGLLGGSNTAIAVGLTAAIIGLAESSGIVQKLPDIPLVGRKGALAIGAWYYSRHGGGTLARDIAIAAAAISGYELGKTGTVTGDDE